MMPQPTNEENLAIELLERAARYWPDSLWIYAADGWLYIMRKDNDKHAMTERGGVDPAFIVTTINIDTDGGDW